MSLFKDTDDFSIDRFNLELEAERNSELMRKYGKKLAFATGTTKDERRKLNFVETECAEIIRSNAESYGLNGRPSDKIVYGLAKNEINYKKQLKKYISAIRREEDYKSAVDTCRQRGMMIRVLTEQWLNNYYSKPVIKRRKLKRIQSEESNY